ncbi:MAG: hypothetical protein L0241_02715 [Planctomycetia bacterium]|nr:hypothetical protein [Planctomycetia bacterium]
MTEAEWLTCEDPKPMLEFLGSKASDRKLRLFAVSCVASSPELLPAVALEGCRLIERIADGDLPRSAIPTKPPWVEMALRPEHEIGKVAKKSCLAATNLYWSEGNRSVSLNALLGHSQRLKVKGQRQTALLRCIFGNPFRPVSFSAAWRTDTAVSLARQMYESRDFSLMPILADALQDAGCDNATILDHCRGPGPHVRGCWVVDLVLGKE